MNRLYIKSLPIDKLSLIVREVKSDSRGSLTRLFCNEELTTVGWSSPVAQINHSYTKKKGTLRGLHFQNKPFSEKKLVTCIRGEIWDVAVDLREGSPTFLNYHAEVLSAENRSALMIPEGFAHGFQSLTDDAEVIYCHSQPYNPEAEAGLNPLDETLAILWPTDLSEISDRDRKLPKVTEQSIGILDL